MIKDKLRQFISKITTTEKNIIGLDIGKSRIKMLEMSGPHLGEMEVSSYSSVTVPPELINENGDFNPENIAELTKLVADCWKKLNTTSKHVAIAIKNTSVISKKVTIPNFNGEEEIQLAVNQELQRIVPENVTLKELVTDYYTIGVSQNIPSENDTVIVASKKDRVDEIQAIVEGAGLLPEILDVETFLYQNLLRIMIGQDFLKGNYVLADCAGDSLRLMVFTDGDFVLSRETRFGGNNLTYDLSNNLGIDFSTAEKLKIDRSGDETYDMIERSFVNNYSSEFISMLHYFSSANSLYDFEQIILIGGVASTPTLADAITQGLLDSPELVIKSEPYVARPLEDAEKGLKINLTKFSQDEPGLFLVTSLALRKYLRQF